MVRFMPCLILCIFLSTAVSAQDKSLSGEEKAIDKDYIKKHFPEMVMSGTNILY
jgi:hypothetical protein